MLTDWGNRYTLTLLGRQKYVNGSTQKSLCQQHMKSAVTPLVMTPFVFFREVPVTVATFCWARSRCRVPRAVKTITPVTRQGKRYVGTTQTRPTPTTRCLRN